MSDLTKLKEILDHQSPKGMKEEGYIPLEYSQEKDNDGYFRLRIEGIKVGFIFNSKGRLVGMYNWQE